MSGKFPVTLFEDHRIRAQAKKVLGLGHRANPGERRHGERDFGVRPVDGLHEGGDRDDEPIDPQVEQAGHLFQELVDVSGAVLPQPEVIAVQRRVELPTVLMDRRDMVPKPFAVDLGEDEGGTPGADQRDREPPEERPDGQVGDSADQRVVEVRRQHELHGRGVQLGGLRKRAPLPVGGHTLFSVGSVGLNDRPTFGTSRG